MFLIRNNTILLYNALDNIFYNKCTVHFYSEKFTVKIIEKL